MVVRSKTGTAPLQHQPGKPKLTRQGNGKRSLRNHGRKQLRGQGKG
jgi:beta-xylosidase